MMSITEDVSEPSSPDTPFDDTDLLNPAVNDDVTAQLAAAGNSCFLDDFDKI